MKHYTWIVDIETQCNLASPSHQFIDKTIYIHIMRLLFSSMYVFAAQGRVAAIQVLTNKHGSELSTSNYTLSSEFKTRGTFGYQPVTLSNVAVTLYKIYWTILRPMVAKKQMCWPDAPLWLDFHGHPSVCVSRMVTRFFMDNAKIHITTNIIRKLVETTAKSCYR